MQYSSIINCLKLKKNVGVNSVSTIYNAQRVFFYYIEYNSILQRLCISYEKQPIHSSVTIFGTHSFSVGSQKVILFCCFTDCRCIDSGHKTNLFPINVGNSSGYINKRYIV